MAPRSVHFPKIFEPAFLGPLEVRNRLIMAPMGSRLSNENGGVSPWQVDYYAERAKGGVGTIIVEITGVDSPRGVTSPQTLTIHEDFYIGGHNELVEAVHAHGARILLQLAHVGRNRRFAMGVQPVAPSPIPNRFFGVTPRELSREEIEDLVKKFIAAALRAQTAGYDGVELHGAHGYLIGEFMSPLSNRRKDRYGGSLEKRMTFPVEIVQGIRRAAGPRYPILFRFSADEFEEGGTTLQESKKAAKILGEAGADVLHVSAGTYDSMATVIEPMSYPEGWKIYLAEAIKSAVKIPVIGVGVIRSPEFAERTLKEGRVDFLALGRALLADPHWPRKAREGKLREIIPCISCNECIGGRTFRSLHVRCAVNPATGREGWLRRLPAEKKKKVVVIGGGPAGLTAALEAKRRGHRVTLYEKSGRLGGQLRLAAAPPGREKIAWLGDYLRNQIRRERVKVLLGITATPGKIVREKPDTVILATGAVPLVPDLPGVESPQVCTAWDILGGEKIVQRKTVLVLGGGMVGCETALYLAARKNKVTVVEMLEGAAQDTDFITRADVLSRMKKAGIGILAGRKAEKIGPGELFLRTSAGREERTKGDIVVLALGAVPEENLKMSLRGKVNEIHTIGDARQPRKIIDAVYEGFRLNGG
jgi:2,4-dienoyl-CoA reductase-like NADH-dependent reductase (Old Yellow Enzyme family)/thioredoxin reductase